MPIVHEMFSDVATYRPSTLSKSGENRRTAAKFRAKLGLGAGYR